MATKYSHKGVGTSAPTGYSLCKECRTWDEKTSSSKKYKFERIFGIKNSRDGSGLVSVRQVIDRKNDHYEKVVVDLQTGAEIRNVNKPLSTHRD